VKTIEEIQQEVADSSEAKRRRPRVVRVLEALLRISDLGKDHLRAWQNLHAVATADTGLMEVASSFFLLTSIAHLEAAALNAAKLTDRHTDSANVAYLLHLLEADRNDPSVSPDWPSGKKALELAHAHLGKMDKIVLRLKHRRDRELAHLDKRHIDLSPEWQGIEVQDLQAVFDAVQKIIEELQDKFSVLTHATRFSVHDLSPEGFENLMYFARVAYWDDKTKSPNERVESIREFDRVMRESKQIGETTRCSPPSESAG
jgi:hypothetical protein